MRVLMALLLLSACGPGAKCHMPSAWKPCPGQAASQGATGAPPVIDSLEMPTCAYLDSPSVTGTVMASDEDRDLATLKITIYQGPRLDEGEQPISGGTFSGTFSESISQPSEGSYDLRIKVTDAQGGQSAPYCGTLALVR